MVIGLEVGQKLDDNDRVCHETRVLVDIVYFAGSLPFSSSFVEESTARLMTLAASMDDGAQPALQGYAARRAREEHELDLLRGWAAWISLGSGGGVHGIVTGADDGTSKSSTNGRGAARKGGKPGHTGSPQATAGES